MKISISAERGRSLGDADIPGRLSREGGPFAHGPKQVEDLNIQGEKRTGIRRSSLKKKKL